MTNAQQSPHLSSSTSHRQVPAVFTEVDLLNAQSWVIAVWVKTANLDNGHISNLVKTSLWVSHFLRLIKRLCTSIPFTSVMFGIVRNLRNIIFPPKILSLNHFFC